MDKKDIFFELNDCLKNVEFFNYVNVVGDCIYYKIIKEDIFNRLTCQDIKENLAKINTTDPLVKTNRFHSQL